MCSDGVVSAMRRVKVACGGELFGESDGGGYEEDGELIDGGE